MGAHDLLEALSSQDEAKCMSMTCTERVQMAVDEAHSTFVTQKVKTLQSVRTSDILKPM